MHNKKIIAIIIGLIISAVLVVGGFMLFQSRFGRAEDYEPSDVTVTVLGTEQQPQAAITWRTGAGTISRVCYGTTITSLNLIADGENTAIETLHTVKLVGLASGTTYYFEICQENDKRYGNNGTPYIFTTKPQLESPPTNLTPIATSETKLILSPTLVKSALSPTPEPKPTLDEEAICVAITEEYKTWDTSCLKEYPSGLCIRCMPRKTK